ncbi:MAG: glycosyltransferase [Oscillospiraceae bacterium]|nr:glycosyltransferase [Oscillospiraceae bacterium]
MKIGFISLDHLIGWTGITRLIDRIAFSMHARGHEITIISQENKSLQNRNRSSSSYPCDFLVIDLSSPEKIDESRNKISASGLDICVGSVGAGQTQLIHIPRLFYKTNIPFIHGEPADPRVFSYERWNPYEHYRVLYSVAAIQVLLEEYIPFYPKILHPKIHVIGNPAQPPCAVDFPARRAKAVRTIIASGRFNEDDKRYSVLLSAFANLCKKTDEDFSGWRLKLVGDGSFRDYYHVLAGQLGIKNFVDFTGAVDNPNPHYDRADIFCLPSFRAEGLPMVFGEAAAHALPIVGFDSCAASAAIINSKIGRLAKNHDETKAVEHLTAALRELMLLSPEEREIIGINARDFFQERFGEEKIFNQWEVLMMNVFENWQGLTPDSPVWTDKLFSGEPPGENPDAEIVRLQCELARLKTDYGTLEKKYTALKSQFQGMVVKNRSNKKSKKRK